MDFSIQHFESLDSTNKEALRQAAKGVKEGLVIVAKEQTNGKGRLGRDWNTIDQALALSILLRPKINAEDMSKLSLVTAVAVHEALSLFAPNIGIKWPNDLLIQGKKVCGILTEMQKKGDGISVVLGIGINIEAPKTWGENMRTAPTSLNQHCAQKVNKDNVLHAILESISAWYQRFLSQGFQPILEAWHNAHIANHKEVSVFDGNAYIQGTALGLDSNGALRLLVNGQEQRIIAGDVNIMEHKS